MITFTEPFDLQLYTYKATVVSVYDGDSITIDWDLGAGVVLHGQKIRLYGINTPELRGDDREAGLISRDYVREMILDKEITMKTYKDKKGKYGRWLAEIFIDGINLNKQLIDMGYAVEYS